MKDPIEDLRFKNAVKHLAYHSDGTPLTSRDLMYCAGRAAAEGMASAFQHLFQRALQIEEGCRMVVDRAVSDMMRVTPLKDVGFEDIVWPAESVELYFEDPSLPTCLMAKVSLETTTRLSTKLGVPLAVTFGEGATHLMLSYDGHDHVAPVRAEYTLHISNSEFARILGTKDHRKITDYKPTSLSRVEVDGREQIPPTFREPLAVESERMEQHHLLRLAFRCLAYACIPQAAVMTSPARRSPYGSNAGVCGRPMTKKPMVHVRMLPTLLRPATGGRAPAAGEPASYSVIPHDRRSHLRVLRHDRWKQRKGEVVLVPAAKIHGGSEQAPVYRVRKVLEKAQ
jgi:hypothetical protein